MNLGLFKKIILLLILAITLIFAAQNFESVTIRFLSWSIHLPIAVTLLGIYALGGITGGLLFSGLKKVVELDKKEHHKKGDSIDDSTISTHEVKPRN